MVEGSKNLQRNLRKARKNAFVIDEAPSRANVEQWYEIHAERHRQIAATPLPKALFIGALEHLVPRDKARFFFVRLNESGEMVAGGAYLYHGSVMDSLMPSVRTRFAKLAPNYWLALYSIRWAWKRGLRYYNWQPSPPAGGVYRFKRQWGSRDVPYYYLTRITGKIEPFLQSSVAEIRAAYPWHYVLPYDQISSASSSGPARSSRQSAWDAQEGRQG